MMRILGKVYFLLLNSMISLNALSDIFIDLDKDDNLVVYEVESDTPAGQDNDDSNIQPLIYENILNVPPEFNLFWKDEFIGKFKSNSEEDILLVTNECFPAPNTSVFDSNTGKHIVLLDAGCPATDKTASSYLTQILIKPEEKPSNALWHNIGIGESKDKSSKNDPVIPSWFWSMLSSGKTSSFSGLPVFNPDQLIPTDVLYEKPLNTPINPPQSYSTISVYLAHLPAPGKAGWAPLLNDAVRLSTSTEELEELLKSLFERNKLALKELSLVNFTSPENEIDVQKIFKFMRKYDATGVFQKLNAFIQKKEAEARSALANQNTDNALSEDTVSLLQAVIYDFMIPFFESVQGNVSILRRFFTFIHPEPAISKQQFDAKMQSNQILIDDYRALIYGIIKPLIAGSSDVNQFADFLGNKLAKFVKKNNITTNNHLDEILKACNPNRGEPSNSRRSSRKTPDYQPGSSKHH